MHEAVALSATADQQSATQFLALKEQCGTGGRLLLVRRTLVDKSRPQQPDHVGLGPDPSQNVAPLGRRSENAGGGAVRLAAFLAAGRPVAVAGEGDA